MKPILRLSAVMLLLCLFTSLALAQDTEQEIIPKKYEDVTWYLQGFIKIAPQKLDSVKQFVEDIYLPATKKVGWNVEMYSYVTSRWNMMIMMELRNGPADLEWEILPESPDLVKHMTENPDNAKFLQRVNSFIEEGENQVIMKWDSD